MGEFYPFVSESKVTLSDFFTYRELLICKCHTEILVACDFF